MSANYISWGSVTNGLKGVASKRKVRRQATRQEKRQEKQEKQKPTVKPTYVKPAPIRYSAYDDYRDEYDDSCCSDSDCGEQPYDHDFYGMCTQRYGGYHGSKKQSGRRAAHATKPKASGKDIYRSAKNSLSS